MELGDEGVRVGEVLDHLVAADDVEGFVLVGQSPIQIGSDHLDPPLGRGLGPLGDDLDAVDSLAPGRPRKQERALAVVAAEIEERPTSLLRQQRQDVPDIRLHGAVEHARGQLPEVSRTERHGRDSRLRLPHPRFSRPS
jgi:hypothetical protein